MKKLIASLLCLMMISMPLSACNNSDKQTVDKENKNIVSEADIPIVPTDIDGKITALQPDRELTGELNACFIGDGSNLEYGGADNDIIRRFGAYFPNVEFNITWVSADYFKATAEQSAKVIADMKKGAGPDLIFFETFDAYKLAKDGMLTDLNEFIEGDQEFSMDDFNKAVIDSCKYNGKQYTFPISYNFPMYMSTKEVLAKNKFELKNCSDYNGCTAEFSKLIKANPQLDMPVEDLTTPTLCPTYTGINWVDYENASYNLDSIELEECINKVNDELNLFGKEYNYEPDPVTTVVQGNTILLSCSKSAFDLVKQYDDMAKVGTPVMVPWRSLDGGIQATVDRSVAIPASAKNKENAYRLLKLLVNTEGTESACNSNAIPINTSAFIGWVEARKYATKRAEFLQQYIGYFDEISSATYSTGATYILRQELNNFYDGLISYDEAMAQASESLKSYFRSDGDRSYLLELNKPKFIN